MRRVLTGLGIVALVVGVAASLMAFAAVPDTVTIDDCASKKAPVSLPHKAHTELTGCTTCHHTDKGLTAESASNVQKCGACHNDPEKEGTPECSQMSLSKNPFHILCINCHKEKAKEDPSTKAPTKCDGCHPKAS